MTGISDQSAHLIHVNTPGCNRRDQGSIQHNVRLGTQIELLAFGPNASEHESLATSSLEFIVLLDDDCPRARMDTDPLRNQGSTSSGG